MFSILLQNENKKKWKIFLESNSSLLNKWANKWSSYVIMELEKGCNRQKLFDLRQYHNKVDILLTFGIAFSSSLRACLGAIRSSVLTDILLNSSSHWALISWAFWIRASVVSRQAGLKVCKWAEMASAANFASPQIPMSISVIINWTI